MATKCESMEQLEEGVQACLLALTECEPIEALWLIANKCREFGRDQGTYKFMAAIEKLRND